VAFAVIRRPDVMPDLLDADGRLRLLAAADYDAIEPDALRYWCSVHGRYGLPTAELVAWLRDYIGDRHAIEIGSGYGDLAHSLGIRATDSKVQSRPDVAALYAAMGAATISYPAWVEEIDAVEAVRRDRPDVAIGSWLTHWIDPALPVPEGGGSVCGIREDLILETGTTYLMIGNLGVHGHKPIMSRPHEEHALPFLRSRAFRPELERVFVWRPA
jgi:hypothetical protein